MMQDKDISSRKTRSAGGEILRAILGTQEVALLIIEAVPEILAMWAGKNPIKKILARLAVRVAVGPFKRRAQDSTIEECSAFYSRPAFVESIARALPGVRDAVWHCAAAAASCVESMPLEKKIELIDALREGGAKGRAGQCIASAARIVNELHRSNPTFFAERIGPALRSCIESIDFGELKEFADLSADDVAAVAREASRALWEYPAKAVCLFAIIPTIINALLDLVREALAPLNEMPPDLLADVLVSLGKEIDPAKAGALANEVFELVRKVQTGSVLIGEKGTPQIAAALERKAEELMGSLDVAAFVKARLCVAEMKESASAVVTGLIEKDRRIAEDDFQSRFRLAAARLRRGERIADAWERVFSDNELAAELEKGLGEIDAQLAGALAGRICERLNAARRISPHAARNLLSQAAAALDPETIGETARWLSEDITEALVPLAGAVVPPLLRGIAELISAAREDNPVVCEEALALLGKALLLDGDR